MSNTSLSQPLLYSVGVAAATIMISGMLHLYWKYWKKDEVPQKWRRIGTLAQINLFPVKSCAPLQLMADTMEVDCDVLGLRVDAFRDRAFMLIDDNHQMITARVHPKMVRIKVCALSSTKLLFAAPQMEDIVLDLATLGTEAPAGADVHTAVWGVKLDAMCCNEKYDRWFSQYILAKETGLHLVYYPYPVPVRDVNPRLTKEPHITPKDTGTFGDATSYMLMNLASVDDLNTRLTRPADPLQFRGNFHLKMDTDQPYAEDKWNWVRIGDAATFRVVAPCTRCIFPNINVHTGERDPDGEPLKTLRSYRLFKNYASPVLGIHLGIRQRGSIKSNDIVYVEDRT